MNIPISSVNVWTPTGVRVATQFAVRSVSYANGPAQADARLLDANGAELAAQIVGATEAQTAAWTDDESFYEVLAQNAGLTPV